MISFAERRPARARGGRAASAWRCRTGGARSDHPGLMLGLVAGGSCDGVAYRVCARSVEPETRILWLREMAFPGYRPAWVDLDPLAATALTFVADEQHVAQQALPVEEQARRIAAAEGALGTNADYLFRTAAAVHDAGGRDRYLETLAALVGAGAEHVREHQRQVDHAQADEDGASGQRRPRPADLDRPQAAHGRRQEQPAAERRTQHREHDRQRHQGGDRRRRPDGRHLDAPRRDLLPAAALDVRPAPAPPPARRPGARCASAAR